MHHDGMHFFPLGNDGRRGLLFDMDMAIMRLNQDHPGHASAVQLTGVYHNLLRRWAES